MNFFYIDIYIYNGIRGGMAHGGEREREGGCWGICTSQSIQTRGSFDGSVAMKRKMQRLLGLEILRLGSVLQSLDNTYIRANIGSTSLAFEM